MQITYIFVFVFSIFCLQGHYKVLPYDLGNFVGGTPTAPKVTAALGRLEALEIQRQEEM